MFDRERVLESVRSAVCGAVPGARVFGLTLRESLLELQAWVTFEPTAEVEARLKAAKAALEADLASQDQGIARVVLRVGQADPAWECIFEAPTLLSDALEWRLERKRDAALRRALAEGVLSAAQNLEGTQRAGQRATPRWLERIVAAAKVEDPRIEGCAPLALCGDSVEARHWHHGWVSSYETGWVRHVYACIPGRWLPADPARAVALLRGCIALGPAVGADEGPAEYACRYCSRTFSALEFDAELGACHGCAESECGVVH